MARVAGPRAPRRGGGVRAAIGWLACCLGACGGSTAGSDAGVPPRDATPDIGADRGASDGSSAPDVADGSTSSDRGDGPPADGSPSDVWGLDAALSDAPPPEPGSSDGAPPESLPPDGAPPESLPPDGALPDTVPSDVASPETVAPDGPVITPGDPGTVDVTFDVRTDVRLRAISPLIYGTNGAPDMARNRPGAVRSGGNRLTAYNWENNASNAGSDWCFQNDAHLSSSNMAGEAVRPMVTSAHGAGAASVVTIPIVDHVAADKTGGTGPPDCSGDVRKSGSDYLATRFKQNRAAKGAPPSPTPDPADAFVNQDEFVAWLRGAVPGARVIFSLDNEPDLWSSTHAEVHPQPVGYDELVDRNVRYATALKAAWPEAEVTGFVSYGWYGYTTLQNAPDRAGKGEFIDYWLDRMKAAETAAGRRLVDYLDLHWYPEAQGGGVRITGTETSAAVVEARVQAPRSLWDPTYTETSWITMSSTMGPIRLIPRIQEKVGARYPGTKLAFTEWNYGGGAHISGAIATADVLGIFGRDGVAMAHIWFLGADESFTLAALRAYRSYDGAGGRFGDTAVEARTTDATTTSVYASTQSAAPLQVVILAINKRTTAATAGIRVTHATELRTARVFRITAASPDLVAAPALPAVATNAFRYVMPAQSVSVILPEP